MMEDKQAQTTPSTNDDQKTVQASTMEDIGLQVTISTDEDQKTVQTVSMEDKTIQVTPSTDEDQKTAQAAAMEDEETQVTPSTEDIKIETRKKRRKKKNKNKKKSSSISSTNHEMASPIPCASAIKDQSCVLSFEKMTCHRILGEGSYGIVVLGSHPAIDQKLAVKIVEKRNLLKSGACELTFTERDALKAGSESPYITHLFGTFQTKVSLFTFQFLHLFPVLHSTTDPDPLKLLCKW